jgi:hypothetical protein
VINRLTRGELYTQIVLLLGLSLTRTPAALYRSTNELSGCSQIRIAIKIRKENMLSLSRKNFPTVQLRYKLSTSVGSRVRDALEIGRVFDIPVVLVEHLWEGGW